MADRFIEALNLISMGRLDDALHSFEAALADDPRNPDILYNLGMCHTDLGQPGKAIVALKKCLEYQPDFANAYVALGVAYSRLGQLDNGKQNFDKALEIDPNNPYALRNLGGLLGKMDDLPGAISCLEKADLLNPGDPQTVYGLGWAQAQAGNLEEAERHYHAILDMDAPAEIRNLAKEGLTEIAFRSLKSKGLRVDAVMYILGALRLFRNEAADRVREISFEIALKGRGGLKINDPDQKYTLRSLPGEFSGLQLVCYMYAGFKRIAPGEDTGIDLSQEYDAAKSLFQDEVN